MLKWASYILAFLGLSIAVYTVSTASHEAPKVPLAGEPSVNPFSRGIAATGIVEASSRNVTVSAPEGGQVTRVFVEVGQTVKLGDPLFDKLNATLAKAMFSINAVKGVSFGDGFDAARSFGSVQNDVFEKTNDQWHTRTNHSGGIQGGISNGMDIVFDVAFKPVSTLMQTQETVDKEGKNITLEGKGRHDPCVLPRAVPIVEAMCALVLADHWLLNKTAKL